MKIETKFNINDLVQFKYTKNQTKKSVAAAFEVIEIHAVNCYTTAQVIYVLRPIHLVTDYDFTEKKHVVIDIAPGRTQDGEYCKFREDELILCDAEIRNVIQPAPSAQ